VVVLKIGILLLIEKYRMPTKSSINVTSCFLVKPK
jgi:hypothetical protein